MTNKKLALIITCVILVIAYAIVVAHNIKEAVAIVCLISLGAILFYGVLSSMHELIKIIRDEE
jgi:uncharacterized membrane protein YccC